MNSFRFRETQMSLRFIYDSFARVNSNVLRYFAYFMYIFRCSFLSGVYIFTLFAAPKDEPGNTTHAAFTYVIYVSQADPDQLPFPTKFSQWNDEYRVNVLQGDLEEGQEREFRLKLPDAKKVMVVTADKNQTQLDQVKSFKSLNSIFTVNEIGNHFRTKVSPVCGLERLEPASLDS